MINFEDRQKTKILRALVDADKKGEVLTSEDIGSRTGISYGSVRGRTSELRKTGMVKATTDARGAQGYFKITEDGLKYLSLSSNIIEV